MITLKTALATYGHTRALKDGSLTPSRAQLEFEEFNPQSQAFKKMVPVSELDLVEMVMTHYLMARDHGKPFIGIPVFPVRQFHHSAITYNVNAGVKEPKDLEGKRVGVRTYGFSRSFWLRGVLSGDYGVDINKITWVVNEAEALPEYQLPPNVEVTSNDLTKMLQDGEIAAGIGVGAGGSADIKPLIDKAADEEAAWFKRTGVYPLSHVLVIRKELVDQDGELPTDLFNAFKEAKQRLMAQIESGAELEGGDRATSSIRSVVGADPLPYGVEANLPTLQMAVDQAQAQGFTTKHFSIEELFDPSTMKLT
jgi:4,5-dihydroxyphthalate decarboxylase